MDDFKAETKDLDSDLSFMACQPAHLTCLLRHTGDINTVYPLVLAYH